MKTDYRIVFQHGSFVVQFRDATCVNWSYYSSWQLYEEAVRALHSLTQDDIVVAFA